ncbi:MAG: hypothetical protein H5T61_14915 [Thermoflexales bacterium]|nr:hypothetical protein [Thermoflexales bacterium]
MLKHQMWFVITGMAILVGLTGALIARAQSDEPPFTVVRVLTEEEAAAGTAGEAHSFNTFEEAMEFIGLNPEDYRNAGSGADQPDQHCVIQIEPLQPGQTESKTSEPVCFDTFSKALFFATEGAIQLPVPAEPGEVTEEMLTPAQSNTVIGIDYSGSNFSGSTLISVTSNPNGCFDGSIYVLSSMPSGWANTISSAKSYQGCARFYHYDYPNYEGAVINCGYSCATMGAMDNQTESEKWCSSCNP